MITMKNPTYLKKLSTACVALLAVVSLSATGVISVNIGANIDETRVLTDYGVPGLDTVVGNWNNIGRTARKAPRLSKRPFPGARMTMVVPRAGTVPAQLERPCTTVRIFIRLHPKLD